MRFSQADGILDLRSRADYKSAHLPSSTHMPWPDICERLNELPAARASFFLVGPEEDIEACSVFLHSKHYDVMGSLVVNSPDDMLYWGNQFHVELELDNRSKRLWSPNSLLEEFLQLEEAPTAEGKNRPLALDLGCGGGRDAVYLAQHRWSVTAIDQEARVIKRAKQLAQNSGAAVKFKCCNLKQAACFPESQFDLIMVMRFLNRDLFETIRQQIKPGGWLVFQTFSEGAEQFGSPKNPNAILRPGELAEVFSDFRIVTDRIDTLQDGRPVASFIAQKQPVEE